MERILNIIKNFFLMFDGAQSRYFELFLALYKITFKFNWRKLKTRLTQIASDKLEYLD